MTFYFLLCYRPFGVQFHVETSLFNLYFAKLERGMVKPVRWGISDEHVDQVKSAVGKPLSPRFSRWLPTLPLPEIIRVNLLVWCDSVRATIGLSTFSGSPQFSVGLHPQFVPRSFIRLASTDRDTSRSEPGNIFAGFGASVCVLRFVSAYSTSSTRFEMPILS